MPIHAQMPGPASPTQNAPVDQENAKGNLLADTLEDMHTVLGDRRITICRELTKIHEEVWRTTLSRALERYRKEEPRGEFTLAVEGRPASHPDLEAEEPG